MVAVGGLLGSLWRFLITVVVSAVVLWIAQKIVLPDKEEQPFLSALLLALVWAVIDAVLNGVFSFLHLGLLGWIVTLVLWIWILKSWFDVDWWTAALISFVAWIISLLVGALWGIIRILI